MKITKWINNNRLLVQSIFYTVLSATPVIALVLFGLIPELASRIRHEREENTKVAVESVFKILEHYQTLAQDGKISKEEAQNQAKSIVKDLRYHDQEYFWINDLTPTVVMHPTKPELDGKPAGEMKDPNGVQIFVEFARVAKEKGAGSVHYMWPKPGAEAPLPKISFVKLFEPWGWVIGNGVYVDDIEADVKKVTRQNEIWLSIAITIILMVSLLSAKRTSTKVVKPISTAVSGLQSETEFVAQTSERLSEVSDALTKTSTQEAGAVQQVASAVTELSEMMARNNESAEHASRISSETAELAQQGKTAVQQVVKAIQKIEKSNHEIGSVVQSNAQNLEALTQIMTEVKSKTQIINDIVFQTKLLSFNASVEAARAGEHGKGFSVVAEEIGKLAKVSGEASVEIGTIIERSSNMMREIATESKEKVELRIKDSQLNLKDGVQKADGCHQLLEDVVQKEFESQAMSADILSATKEQSLGVSEIQSAIHLLDSSNQENRKYCLETKSTSEELSTHSGDLHKLVGSLKNITSSDADLTAA